MCPHATSQGLRAAKHAVLLGALALSVQSCQRSESPAPQILGSALPTQSSIVATLTRPTAAALSANGKTLYVLAQAEDETYQLYAGAVGSALSVVPTSLPLAYPVALALRRDDRELLIVDLGSSDADAPAGVVYRGTLDGALTPLVAPDMQRPTAAAIAADDRSAYITGYSAQTGQAGVWNMPFSEGSTQPIFQGAPLAQPIGIAVASDGGVYVADAQGSSPGTGGIFRIAAGQAVPISNGPLSLSFPSGICPAGRPSPDLLISAPLLTGTEPWLLRVSPSGTIEDIVLPSATEVTALNRAADVDLWVAIDAVVPSSAASSDPLSPERPQGHILLLTP